MSLTTTWAAFFDGTARMHGRSHLNQGRVEWIPAENGEVFRARVMDDPPQTVVFHEDGSLDHAQCSCDHFEQGKYCQHIWAALLYLDDMAGGATEPPAEDETAAETTSGSGAPAPSITTRSNGNGDGAYRLPKARKRRGGRVNGDEPAWMKSLALLRVPGSATEALTADAVPDVMQICYVILAEASREHGQLVVELRKQEPTRDGWGQPKRMKLTAEQAGRLNDAADREICSHLFGGDDVEYPADRYASSGQRAQGRFAVPPGSRHVVLQKMIATRRCTLEPEQGPDVTLRWQGEQDDPWRLWLIADEVEEDLTLHLELRRAGKSLSIDEPALILCGTEGLVFNIGGSAQRDGWVAPLDDHGASRWVSQFRDNSNTMTVPMDEVARFLDHLYLLPNLPDLDLPERFARSERLIVPTPRLELLSPQGQQRQTLTARLRFVYGGIEVLPGQAGRFVSPLINDVPPAEATDDTTVDDPDVSIAIADAERALSEMNGNDEPSHDQAVVRRDHYRERACYLRLLNLGFRTPDRNEPDRLHVASAMVPAAVQQLLADGWDVIADQRVIRRAAAPNLSVRSGIDWFELRGSVRFETESGPQFIDLPRILRAAREGRATVQLDDGSEGLLPQEWLEHHGVLAALGKVESDHLRFTSSQAVLIDALLTDQDNLDVDQHFADIRNSLHRFEGVTPIEPAGTFEGSLRMYQREGLGWLKFLEQFGLGGILADDMGLGKTIQVLALLDRHYGEQRQEGTTKDKTPDTGPHAAPKHSPSLIVVPRSVIFNWMDEAKKFTPNLRVVAYTGTERHELRNEFDNHDVIVTSYGLMRRDIDELTGFTFEFVVLDEAQAIKNPNSQSAKAARLLNGNHRLALTGTPIENHLGDLWSIFEYLNPGMLGANTRFAEALRRGMTDQRQGNVQQDAAIQVARAIRPFILRRTKDAVLSDLPPKTEQTLHCEMEPDQRAVYDELREYYRRTLLQKPGADGEGAVSKATGAFTGGGGGSMLVLEALLRLRQAACHPGLIDNRRSNVSSAKMKVLIRRLTDLIEEGHKALVFSQFTSMLALVRQELDRRGIAYGYLDGQTRERKRVVEQFQNDPNCPLFLISLKAGGVGLNLTAAEYVFILDPWWNPAAEAQAIDRTHRIGQTRHVFAYKLICEDTVEQRILELQDRKRQLANAVVGGQDNLLKNLTKEDLEQLLS